MLTQVGVWRKLSFVVAALVAMAASSAAIADSPTLVWNRQIGDMTMRESRTKVVYEYGNGHSEGCVYPTTRCVVRAFRYQVGDGHIWTAFYRPFRSHRPGHLVVLRTNSPYYKTGKGYGVGTKIPYGHKWHHFYWHECNGFGYWLAGTSWKRPLWRHGGHRWWTQLYMHRGRVSEIQISLGWYAGLGTQGC